MNNSTHKRNEQFIHTMQHQVKKKKDGVLHMYGL